MTMDLPDRGRMLDWAGLLLLIALVAPFVVYAVPGVVGAQGGYVVLSGSMEPSIGVGDVVIVDDVTPAEIEEGDVITYLRPDAETPTTHRVIDVTEQSGERAFITQGDANDDPDSAPVPESQVLGEVAVVIPYMGYVIEFVNTPTGFLALVVVPFVLLALSEVRSVLGNGGGTGATGAAEETDSDRTAGDGESDPDAGSAEAPPMGPFEAASVDDEGTDDRSSASTPVSASEDAEPSGEPIAITRTDLRLSGLVLTGTTAYAGWVVYHVQTAWSFAVAFGSGFGLLLVGGMYYAAGEADPDDDDRTAGRETADRVDDRPQDGGGVSRETGRSNRIARADGEGGSIPATDDLGIEEAQDPSLSSETEENEARGADDE